MNIKNLNSRYSMQASKAVLSSCLLLIAIIFLCSCGGKPSEDPCCKFAELPAGAEIKAGQGFLQVEGSTSAYFYVFDESGKQVSYQILNMTLALDPGKYQARVNNSSYPVEVKEGMLAKCSTGTLMVSGATSEYYYVMDSTNRQLSYDGLGKATSLFASTFLVKVNNTQVRTKVELNKVTEIQSGTLIVHGGTGEYYYVLDAMGNQLNYNSLEKPLAFLSGSYRVKVNNTPMKADIKGGQVTELSTCTILVNGLTDEYYYVLDSLGNQLNYQTLNKPLAFFPYSLRIRVNNTETVAKAIAGTSSAYGTGSLMVTGSGTDYYYVLDGNGNQLNYNSLNKPLSFFPAEYTVKLGQSTRKTTVTVGQLTTIAAFK